MIPPRGFKAEQYPLRHQLLYSFGLALDSQGKSVACCPIIMGSTDVDVDPETIQVNPHNTNYEEDTGPLCRQMSIIDKLRISLRFNMTESCQNRAHTSGTSTNEVFTGDDVTHLRFLWRPIFFSFPEKLQATDDDTGTTVETILGLTSDDTNEDVVPITTTKLIALGGSDIAQPVSTVNAVQVFGDFNMTTNTTMEGQVWDEVLFQNALRRFTNKGALKACIGRTRHVNLTRARPFKNFYIDQPVPRSVRRVVDRTFMAIQVVCPINSTMGQDFYARTFLGSVAHLGVRIIANYHEWNSEHDQDMTP